VYTNVRKSGWGLCFGLVLSFLIMVLPLYLNYISLLSILILGRSILKVT